MHFWSIKGVYFLKNANNLNLKLFLGCICIVFHLVFFVLNRLSNLEFRRRKKVLQVFQMGGGNLDNIQKKAFFSKENVFYIDPCVNSNSHVWNQTRLFSCNMSIQNHFEQIMNIITQNGMHQLNPKYAWTRLSLCFIYHFKTMEYIPSLSPGFVAGKYKSRATNNTKANSRCSTSQVLKSALPDSKHSLLRCSYF